MIGSPNNGHSAVQSTETSTFAIPKPIIEGVTDNSLRARRIRRRAESDPKKLDLQKQLKTQPLIFSDHIAASQLAALEIHRKKDPFKMGYILWKAIAMNILDEYLPPTFRWNADEQWTQPDETCLPSREFSVIPLPKPDLAVSYAPWSLLDNYLCAPLARDLLECIWPAGNDQCFPFLFMEQVSADADIGSTHLTNLHSASQALWNIYHWVSRARNPTITEQFFDHVRVFSVAMYSHFMEFRVHRATPYDGEHVVFRFDDLESLRSLDAGWAMVNGILKEYAEKELRSFLRAALHETLRATGEA